MIKKLTAALLALMMFAATGCGKTEKGTPAEIVASDGTAMASVTYTGWGYVELEDEGYASYVDIVIREAVCVLAEKWGMEDSEAEKKFVSEGYSVETVFDPSVFASLISGETEIVDNIAVAVTDLNGALLATYARGDKYNEDRNLANEPFLPCSAFKPLSVYAPAIEAGLINWSSTTLDSPVKVITDERGQKRDWPSNATGVYTEKEITVEQAIKESVNTVAVKTLMEYGVDKSISKLSESYGIDTSYEAELSESYGDDEVLANIGLGYLKAGVTAVDMAGYYQAFAKNGVYTEPYAIKCIKDANGESVYEASPKPKQVMSEETACVMNFLLRTVVEKGGTGQAAGNTDVIVGGKTGTGDNADEGWTDNWFVGFTPTYTCAVWHSSKKLSNMAAAMFAEVTKGIELEGAKDFEACSKVIQVAYCTESGKRLGEKCRSMDVGYFVSGKVPEKCNEH